MQSKYLYAGTYSSLLINRLLTGNQRELLLGSASLDEVRKVLQDTCFAPYLGNDRSLAESLDDFVVAQKKRLLDISPDPRTLEVLLLRYDYNNLNLIHKALAKDEREEEIVKRCWVLGTIEPARLYRAIVADKVAALLPELAEVLTLIKTETKRSAAEITDHAYLVHAHKLAKAIGDRFISSYLSTMIDLYNVQMRLRSFVHTESESIMVHGELVAGGTLTADDLGSLEDILKRLPNFGGNKLWQDAIAKFNDTHDFTPLDRAFDNYVAEFLKQATIDPHTSAPLYAYFLSAIEHAQFVRTVIAAHNVGLSEVDLRVLVRNSIHDYAY